MAESTRRTTRNRGDGAADDLTMIVPCCKCAKQIDTTDLKNVKCLKVENNMYACGGNEHRPCQERQRVQIQKKSVTNKRERSVDEEADSKKSKKDVLPDPEVAESLCHAVKMRKCTTCGKTDMDTLYVDPLDSHPYCEVCWTEYYSRAPSEVSTSSTTMAKHLARHAASSSNTTTRRAEPAATEIVIDPNISKNHIDLTEVEAEDIGAAIGAASTTPLDQAVSPAAAPTEAAATLAAPESADGSSADEPVAEPADAPIADAPAATAPADAPAASAAPHGAVADNNDFVSSGSAAATAAQLAATLFSVSGSSTDPLVMAGSDTLADDRAMSATDMALQTAVVIGYDKPLADVVHYDANNYYDVPLSKGGTGAFLLGSERNSPEVLNRPLLAYSTLLQHTSGTGIRDSKQVSVWGGEQPQTEEMPDVKKHQHYPTVMEVKSSNPTRKVCGSIAGCMCCPHKC